MSRDQTATGPPRKEFVIIIRTSTASVTFRATFQLPGWEAPWPAGTYTVDTDEEQLDLSYAAYRRVATRIVLRRGAETRHVTVSAADLDAALQRDAVSSPSAG